MWAYNGKKTFISHKYFVKLCRNHKKVHIYFSLHRHASSRLQLVEALFIGCQGAFPWCKRVFPGFLGENPVSLGDFSKFQASFPEHQGAKKSSDSVQISPTHMESAK